jgi:outer membrane receptor protein involved in Fe transport
MRLPTQILLLGAILTSSARATETPPAASPAAATQAAPAYAPDAPVQLEPVIVTADLWQTPLEKITASVSVYDGTRFASDGVRHFGDLADQIPNLTWTGGTSRPRYFQIRGIGENSQYEGESPDSSVAFKIDDLDFTGIGGIGSTFDVRQVEVLRGPQAGAFGANAAGGLIQIVTNDPTPHTTGFVEGTLGTDDLREVGFALGGTVTPATPDKLMFRIAAQHSESDGFRKNVTLGDTNARDEDFVRLKLTWNPNALWSWDGALFFAEADNGFDEFALDNNGERTFSDEPGRDFQRSLAGSLRGTYRGFENVTFTTVTTANTTDSLYSYDSDWADTYSDPIAYQLFVALDRQRDTWSEELRFDSTDGERVLGLVDRWTLGAQFGGTREQSSFTSVDNLYGGFGRMDGTYEAFNTALFAQLGHDLSDRTRVTLGLRAEYVDMRSDVRNDAGLADDDGEVPLNFTLNSISPRFDDVMAGGKLTLEHDFTPTQQGWVSAARGYKAGGVATDSRIYAYDPQSYDTETLWNYELGLRSRFLENRVRNQLTLFVLDRGDTQVRDSAGFGGTYRFYTDNAGRALTYGLEDEFSYEFVDDWSLYGSVSLMQSDIEAFTLSNGRATGGGGDLANVPDYGYSLGVKYHPARGFFGRVEIVGRDSYLESNTHAERRRAYDLVNASIGYAWRNWRVTLWASNLFDEAYDKRVFSFGNDPATGYATTRYESRADPRQVGVTAAYDF